MHAFVLSDFSLVQFFMNLWTVALQVPLSMGFSRQEYWNGLPFSSPGDLSNPGIKPTSLKSATLAGGFFTTSKHHLGSPFASWKVKVKLLSCVRLFATLWTVAYQALLSMGFSRQEYWSGVPFPSPGDLPNPGIKPGSPALAGRFFLPLSHLGRHGSKYFIYFFIRNFEIVPYWTLS